MGGQSVCAGCGSELILCERESLLTKVTTSPTLMVTLFGFTPAEVIVIVAPTGPVPDEGDVGELPPPHAGSNESAPTMSVVVHERVVVMSGGSEHDRCQAHI